MNELWMVILTSLQLVMTLARLEWRSVGGSASVTCYRITEAQSSLRQENRYLYTHLTATIVNITNVWKFQDYISFHIVSPNS